MQHFMQSLFEQKFTQKTIVVGYDLLMFSISLKLDLHDVNKYVTDK